jgi:chemotaxis protein MotA
MQSFFYSKKGYFKNEFFLAEVKLSLFLILTIVCSYIFYSDSTKSVLSLTDLLFVLGGTLGLTLASYPPNELRLLYRELIVGITTSICNPADRIDHLLALGKEAKIKGILCLESECREVLDPFLKKLLLSAVDASDPITFRDKYTSEIELQNSKRQEIIESLSTISSYAPTFGFVGSLIGLVKMLSNIENINLVGGAISGALLTTFYGAIISQIFLTPLIWRLNSFYRKDRELKQITVTGVSTIIAGVSSQEARTTLRDYMALNQ